MQTNIGYMYLNGYGVTQNYQEALKWHRLAANQGNAAAQYSLDVMYGNGKGVTQDYQEALKWDRLAADQGDALWLLQMLQDHQIMRDGTRIKMVE